MITGEMPLDGILSRYETVKYSQNKTVFKRTDVCLHTCIDSYIDSLITYMCMHKNTAIQIIESIYWRLSTTIVYFGA